MNTIVTIVGKALAGGLALALIVAPVTVRAADADLVVTVTGPRNEVLGTGDPDVGTITVGQTKAYKLAVSNKGPSTARGVTLAFPTLDAKLEIVQVTGCALKVTDPVKFTIDPNLPAAWPCTLSDVQDLTTATVMVYVTYKTTVAGVPADFPTHLPAVCPATDPSFALSPYTFAVTASGTTDPNPADNTKTATTPTGSMTDVSLDITMTSAFQIGQDAVYRVTATNHGPCDAIDIWLADWNGASAFLPPSPYSPAGASTEGTLVWKSSVGDADANTPDCEAIWDNCELGDIAVGASKVQTLTYVPQPLPKNDIMQSSYPFSLMALSGDVTYDFGRNFGQQLDPIMGNNSATVSNLVTQDVSTCSTGGMPGLLGLLALGLLPLARRRRD